MLLRCSPAAVVLHGQLAESPLSSLIGSERVSLIKAEDARPAVAENLQNDNLELRAKLAQERDELKAGNEQLARVVHVLEVENQQLRAALKEPDNVRLLQRRPN